MHAVDARSSTLNYAWAGGLPDAVELKITRVAFAESLEALGWTAGPLAPRPPPNRRLDELEFLRIDSATIEPGASRARLEPGGESPALREFAVSSNLACPRFVDLELGRLPGQIEMVTVNSTTAVAVGRDQLAIVRADQSFER